MPILRKAREEEDPAVETEERWPARSRGDRHRAGAPERHAAVLGAKGRGHIQEERPGEPGAAANSSKMRTERHTRRIYQPGRQVTLTGATQKSHSQEDGKGCTVAGGYIQFHWGALLCGEAGRGARVKTAPTNIATGPSNGATQTDSRAHAKPERFRSNSQDNLGCGRSGGEQLERLSQT